MSRTRLSKEEFSSISRGMEQFHGVFSQVWKMGRPTFTDRIPTAAVSFDRKSGGFIDFMFNPDFYDSLTENHRSFVICHESLHVMFSHGKRSKGMNRQIANVAQDIVINESLAENFGFDRDEIDPVVLQPESGEVGRRYCWLDTVFKPEENVPRGRNFEFYYDLLKKKTMEEFKKALKNGSLNITVDSHEGLESFDDDVAKEMSDAIKDSLSKEELEALKDRLEATDKDPKGQQAGTVAGSLVKVIAERRVAKKKKWETVIKKWSKKYLTNDFRDVEQWCIEPRRLSMMNRPDVFLPSDYEMSGDVKDKRRIDVMFLIDSSGSCVGLADRFWDAANSLPEDRFNLDLCCFDTEVVPLNIKERKLYGFGGTSFHSIETYIQNKIKKTHSKYPDAVFLITDGAGTHVKPEFPDRWYWFLSSDYRYYIPKESRVFMLSDFE